MNGNENQTKIYIDPYVKPNTNIEQRQFIVSKWYSTELKKLMQWETKQKWYVELFPGQLLVTYEGTD